MVRFVLRRVLLAVLTLFAISTVTFFLFFAVPTNPAEVMCGDAKACSPQKIAQIERRLGLNKPLTTQYADFMRGVFVGRDIGTGETARDCPAPCLGFSFHYDEPVTGLVMRRLPATLSIVFGAALVQVGLGVAIGMLSALRRGTVFDKVAVGVSLTGASMQVYFLGYLLMILLVYEGGLLPNPGYTALTDNPAAWIGGLMLPWITLGFINSAVYARLSRAQMLETLSEDYVRTARAKGLPRKSVYGRHALRAAITPIVTIAGLDIGAMLGGTVITESVFGIKGMGKTAVDAVRDLDMPVVMATVMFGAFFIVLANIIVDFSYAAIDPRVRLR